MAAAPRLPGGALRVLADAVRDRRRRPRPGGVPDVGAPAREARARSPAPLRPVPEERIPGGPLDAARPEPDPDGHLLHRAPLPAGGPGARRARDRGADAPGLRGAVRRLAGRLRAVAPAGAKVDRPRRARRDAGRDGHAPRRGQARALRPGLPRLRWAFRRGDGPRDLPARERRPVVRIRPRPQRGGGYPEHRAAAGVVTRDGAPRRGRHHRPDRRVSTERRRATRRCPRRFATRWRSPSAAA